MNTKNTHSIIIPVLILVLIGAFMVYSSTAFASMRNNGSGFYYLWKHLLIACLGIVIMFVLSKTDHERLRPFVYILLGASMILLLLVFVPGIGKVVNGARRWLKLWLITFQPSEFLKIAMVLFLADYIDKNIHRMRDFKHGIAIPVGVMMLFQGVIILQPDFGAVISLSILTFGLLILGGAKLSHIGILFLSSLPVIYILIVSSPYRLKRTLCFLNPWKEPYGCGFQLIQSFIAFGKGGFTGVGLGDSKQKLYFLPEVHTDFIFSLIGEELGLIGTVAVLGLFLWLFIKGIQISRQTDNPFSYFLAFGLTMMISIQAIINFAVSTGLMPTKGLPLPFVSYGGSALLVNMAAVGILINISRCNETKNMRATVYNYSRHNSYMRG